MPWSIPVITAFVSACLTQLGNFIFQKWKDKQQKIALSIGSWSVFEAFTIADKKPSILTITSNSGTDYRFENLFCTELDLKNTSNLDFEEFTFILCTPDGYDFVNIEETTSGAHHEVIKEPHLDFSLRGTKINLTLKPFNRGDSYNIKAYTTSNKPTVEPPKLEYDTRKSIKFTLTDQNEEYLKSEKNFWLLSPYRFILFGYIILLVVSFCLAIFAANKTHYYRGLYKGIVQKDSILQRKIDLLDTVNTKLGNSDTNTSK